jgi:hypothetical protein
VEFMVPILLCLRNVNNAMYRRAKVYIVRSGVVMEGFVLGSYLEISLTGPFSPFLRQNPERHIF